MTHARCLAFLALAALVACEPDTPTGPGAPARVSIAEAVSLEVFASRPVDAVVTDAGGRTLQGAALAWAVDDTTVATVSADGVLTGTGVGRTIVVASLGAHADTAEVTVLSPPVARLVVDADSLLLGEAGTWPVAALAYDTLDRLIPGSPVHWQTSDGDVARVGAAGAVEAVRPGEAVLVAAAGEATDTLTVRVEPGWLEVQPSYHHVCGVRADGRGYCWGTDLAGKLGTGPRTEPTFAAPQPVAGGVIFASISPGLHHTCGVTPMRLAFCWGANQFGQLGMGQRLDSCGSYDCAREPVPVAGDHRFTHVSPGEVATCGLTAAGEAFCWGLNFTGLLGTDAGVDTAACGQNCSLSPVRVAGAPPFEQVSMGAWYHACGRTAGGETWCWGRPLMTGVAPDTAICDERRCPVALRVPGVPPFEEIRASFTSTCGRTAAGDVYCWGYELPPTRIALPVPLASLGRGPIADEMCGLTEDGRPWCWSARYGTPAPGELALPGGVAFRHIATTTPYFPDVRACGVTVTNVAYCWDAEWQGPTLLARPEG